MRIKPTVPIGCIRKGKRLWIIAGSSLAMVVVVFAAYLAYAFQAGPVEGRPTLMYFRADL